MVNGMDMLHATWYGQREKETIQGMLFEEQWYVKHNVLFHSKCGIYATVNNYSFAFTTAFYFEEAGS